MLSCFFSVTDLIDDFNLSFVRAKAMRGVGGRLSLLFYRPLSGGRSRTHFVTN